MKDNKISSISKFLRIEIFRFNKYSMIYNLFMAILAIGIVVTIIIDSNTIYSSETIRIAHIFDKIVWIIFIFDYVVRLVIAEDKFLFVRHNIIDLIAIFPFDAVFQGLRATRLVRLLLMIRSFAYLNRVYMRIGKVLKTNDFDHVLWFTFCTIFIGAISISFIDDMEIGNAFWWSFVTTTTVGYGDIAPTSTGGRLVAVFLMIVGIGFLSTLTGTISTFFINNMNKINDDDYTNKELCTIHSMLNNFNVMSIDDINKMHRILLALKKEE